MRNAILWGRLNGFRLTVGKSGEFGESRGEVSVVPMNDAAATSLVSAAPRRLALRRITAARLIVAGVIALETAWVGGLSVLVYEVIR